MISDPMMPPARRLGRGPGRPGRDPVTRDSAGWHAGPGRGPAESGIIRSAGGPRRRRTGIGSGGSPGRGRLTVPDLPTVRSPGRDSELVLLRVRGCLVLRAADRPAPGGGAASQLTQC
eukprot:756066-Hanusia_phi.AAC.1